MKENGFSGAQATPEFNWPHALNKSSERQFEQITGLVQLHYGVDMAFLSLTSESRQRVKVGQGLALERRHKAEALCDILIQQDGPLIIPDANQSPYFEDSALVDGYPFICFFAGIPIHAPNGLKVGTLCLSDSKSRLFSSEDLEVLKKYGTLIENELAHYPQTNENQRDRQNQLLSHSISKAQNIFLATDDDHAAFEALLDDLLVLTDSAFGLIGEILNNVESGQPYVQVRAVTNIAWDEETAQLYSQVKQGGLAFHRLDNLIGAAVLTRDVVISDHVPSDARRGGTGRGHPPISTYIGIPVFFGSDLVGLIGLANRTSNYSREFAQWLEPLTRTVGILIERKRLYAERARQHGHIEHAANFDLLTGLPNRRLLTQLFDERISEAGNNGSSLSICFIDLDGFKEVNDTYGHEAGDAVLQHVGNRLTGVIRDADVVARISGDEFVAILQDVNDPGAYQRILESINEPFSYDGRLINLSASMGVTLYPADNSDRDLLLRHADQAMYTAKVSGKNRISFFGSDRHRMLEEEYKIAKEFSRALSENELELYFQPKIELQRSKVVGFEALIRWNHPAEGLLHPDRFLPDLTHTEYEIQLGEFVVSESVKAVQRFAKLGAGYTLNINIGARHTLNDDFLIMLEEKIEVLPQGVRKNLVIEVPEALALEDTALATRILASCKRLGVALSLESFGTGFSSLSCFRMLPVDEVKIDKSLVTNMLNDAGDNMVVRSIIGLAREFNRKVVGEGVESIEIAEELVKMGCDFAQGYHFSEPLPLEEALNWSRQFG